MCKAFSVPLLAVQSIMLLDVAIWYLLSYYVMDNVHLDDYHKINLDMVIRPRSYQAALSLKEQTRSKMADI